MFPTNPRELKRRMKQLGIDVEELKEVKSITIEFSDKELIIREPQVVVMKFQDQKIYYVSGGVEEVSSKEVSVESAQAISEDDVRFVMEQTGASREEAIEALRKAGGDIPQAILMLTEKR
ncbi:MAG: nascent polypeptide-associated complex protein [Desulfurococcaceae archaeon]|jgi:nascent polypeptide-associated complex subunit alpha|nr:nascent polypeptide-associated complex protein [Desulfurococcaceae archaeon]